MTHIREIHIGEGDGDGGGQCSGVQLLIASSGRNSVDGGLIIRTSCCNRNVLGRGTALTITDGDRKDFTSGLIFG